MPKRARCTEILTFKGFNIKGNPKMSAARVRHDLRVFKRHPARLSVGALQEFRWPWYWAMLKAVMPTRRRDRGYRAFPHKYAGARSAQPVVWARAPFKLIETRQRRLHAASKVSATRFVNAVLLEHEATGLRCWYWSTHFAANVKGRERITAQLQDADLTVFWDFVDGLVATGHPVLGEGDFNIRASMPAHARMARTVQDKPVRYIGREGVEYCFAIDGDQVRIDVVQATTVPVSKLNTDHEGRIVRYRLVASTKEKP